MNYDAHGKSDSIIGSYIPEHCYGSLQTVPPRQPVHWGCSWRSLAQNLAQRTHSGSCYRQCTLPGSRRCETMACELIDKSVSIKFEATIIELDRLDTVAVI